MTYMYSTLHSTDCKKLLLTYQSVHAINLAPKRRKQQNCSNYHSLCHQNGFRYGRL